MDGVAEGESFLNGKVRLFGGDNREVLKSIPDDSIDSIVCDPPYALVSIVKRFGNESHLHVSATKDHSTVKAAQYKRLSGGFMGQKWDTGESAHAVEFWQECLRVLKPGGHVVAFAGTRTYHRLACAIEDAGFEIRDMIQYLYGSGFPKSHSVDRGLGDAACRCGDNSVRGLRQGSKDADGMVQAGESADMLASMQRSSARGGMGEAWSEGLGGAQDVHANVRPQEPCVEGRRDISETARQLCAGEIRSLSAGIDGDGANRRLCDGTSTSNGKMGHATSDTRRVRPSSGSPTAKQRADELGTVAGQSKPQVSGAWDHCGRCGKPMVQNGLGTALKPANEPIALARKPLSEKTVAANVLKWGTRAINVDGCRVGIAADDLESTTRNGEYDTTNPGIVGFTKTAMRTPINAQGRWPANVLTDGSDEVVGMFPDSGPAKASARGLQHSGRHGGLADIGGNIKEGSDTVRGHDDAGGSTARFFYTSKADSDDRLGSKHPTVKPVDLMQWLVRLVTKVGGTVLDPFAGTGSTAEAAYREGMSCILIEREEEYQADIRRRMALVLSGPDERARESIKAKTKDLPPDHGPLFA